jgi:hypothetical protein
MSPTTFDADASRGHLPTGEASAIADACKAPCMAGNGADLDVLLAAAAPMRGQLPDVAEPGGIPPELNAEIDARTAPLSVRQDLIAQLYLLQVAEHEFCAAYRAALGRGRLTKKSNIAVAVGINRVLEVMKLALKEIHDDRDDCPPTC